MPTNFEESTPQAPQVTQKEGEQKPDYVTQEQMERFMDKINQTITGAVGRAKKETTQSLTENISKQQTKIEEMIEQWAQRQKETDGTIDEGRVSKAEPSPDASELQSQMEELMQWKAQQAEYAEAQANRIQELETAKSQAEKKAENEQVKNLFIKSASERVHYPEQLLNLALTTGEVVVIDGQPMMKTDKLTPTGDFKMISGPELIDELLAKPQYSHFKKAAPPQGTGYVAGYTPTMPREKTVVGGIPLEESEEERYNRIAREYGVM